MRSAREEQGRGAERQRCQDDEIRQQYLHASPFPLKVPLNRMPDAGRL